ncbi:diguanylate cyclase [Curvibacter sp. CHRR-16]|uniref:sensor domain-containing diguanylate cyclase n=1 Tax=Curvibacter sp. CHRR-16 TaxID=2835872 RepID=UPI001BD9AB0B|nr:sensor domain-containing diguanylate cyclase [Curvibacter sp. CHRR-16]MBT0571199.1 diguanylate cyclase [Curvibacter sp. CHRR-16]
MVDTTSTLFERLPIGVYRFTPDGHLLHANTTFCLFNGFNNVEELRAWLEKHPEAPYVQPDRRQTFWRMLMRDKQVYRFDSEMYRLKTGELMWVREHAYLVEDSDGKPLYCEGTLEDVTTEYIARFYVKQNESLLRQVLQTMPGNVWLRDLDGVFIAANDAYVKSLHTTHDKLIGSRLHDHINPVTADAMYQTDIWVLQRNASITYEEQSQVDNELLPHLFEVTKVPLHDDDGNIIGVLGVSKDIQDRKTAENLLRETTEQLELALMGADLGRWKLRIGADMGFSVDARTCAILGYPESVSQEVSSWVDWIHPEDWSDVMTQLQQHLRAPQAGVFQGEYRTANVHGDWVWVSLRGKAVQFDKNGSAQCLVGTLMDISERKQAEAQLRATQAELQATLAAVPDWMFEFDAQGTFLAIHSQGSSAANSANLAYYRLHTSVVDTLPQHAADVCMQAIRQAEQDGASYGLQYALEEQGSPAWYELSVVRKEKQDNEDLRFIAIARNITARKLSEEAMAHLAYHDPLTGLPNRRVLMDRLHKAIAQNQHKSEHAALLFLDLDRFKHINDTLGHEVGDLLLKEVSKRLQHNVRSVDTVSRLGGDEFVVLIQELAQERALAQEHALVVGDKLLSALNAPYVLDQTHLVTTPSIGLVLFHAEVTDPTELLKQADAAMYQAKKRGRNNVCLHG